jgi:hypothetical protein
MAFTMIVTNCDHKSRIVNVMNEEGPDSKWVVIHDSMTRHDWGGMEGSYNTDFCDITLILNSLSSSRDKHMGIVFDRISIDIANRGGFIEWVSSWPGPCIMSVYNKLLYHRDLIKQIDRFK